MSVSGAAALRRAVVSGVLYFGILTAMSFALGFMRGVLHAADSPDPTPVLYPLSLTLTLYAAWRLTRARPELQALGPAIVCGAVGLALEIATAWALLRAQGASLGDLLGPGGSSREAHRLFEYAVFVLAPAMLRPRRRA